ncbi:hypothetical protein NEICINOT_04545 [Neisseria cinerea ATCC 14685]|uniref:Uncharacterized protein n=1 Tax=Neisseria cinerea ATCC 14685 TaxID=546262 RepID=D0W4E7_NEICI|nr:hypothetical protein NEICINOT_04545 [Neisseria cinerea ATCC 14685]
MMSPSRSGNGIFHENGKLENHIYVCRFPFPVPASEPYAV